MQQKMTAEKKVISKARWLYVILGLVIMMVLGTVYSWSVFRLPVEELYNVGAAQSGLPYMTALLFYSLFMFLTGRFFKTWSPRTILMGMLCFNRLDFIGVCPEYSSVDCYLRCDKWRGGRDSLRGTVNGSD